MEHIGAGPIPQEPRHALVAPLLPFFLTEQFSPAEITVERLAFAVEVEASRPSWQIALAGALVALDGAS